MGGWLAGCWASKSLLPPAACQQPLVPTLPSKVRTRSFFDPCHAKNHTKHNVARSNATDKELPSLFVYFFPSAHQSLSPRLNVNSYRPLPLNNTRPHRRITTTSRSSSCCFSPRPPSGTLSHYLLLHFGGIALF